MFGMFVLFFYAVFVFPLGLQAVADESRLGIQVRTFVEKGMMAPDNVVIEILKERLSALDAVSRGWILHGFPRNKDQAQLLADAGVRGGCRCESVRV